MEFEIKIIKKVVVDVWDYDAAEEAAQDMLYAEQLIYAEYGRCNHNVEITSEVGIVSEPKLHGCYDLMLVMRERQEDYVVDMVSMIKEKGGKVTCVDDWGTREISPCNYKAWHVLLTFEADEKLVKSIRLKAEKDKIVFRHLLVRKD